MVESGSAETVIRFSLLIILANLLDPYASGSTRLLSTLVSPKANTLVKFLRPRLLKDCIPKADKPFQTRKAEACKTKAIVSEAVQACAGDPRRGLILLGCTLLALTGQR